MKVLTISVAAYNVEKFIRETLDSLIVPEIIDKLEVIVVNDGSKDSTKKIVEEYTKKYPQTFYLVDKENGGYGSTINASLPMAHGKYYKLLDGDDWFNQNYLIEFIKFLEKIESDLIIMPNIEVISETGEKTIVQPFDNIKENKVFSYKEYPIGKRLSMHQVAFKTETIQNKGIQIREHCFYTDTEYLLKGMSKCNSLIYVNYPMYMYRIGLDEQSMSFNSVRKNYKDAITYYKELIRFRNEENIAKDFGPYFLDAMISGAKYNLNIFFLLSPKKKSEYIEFEQFLKNNAPDIYEHAITKKIKLLRKLKYHFYWLFCIWGTQKAKKQIRM